MLHQENNADWTVHTSTCMCILSNGAQHKHQHVRIHAKSRAWLHVCMPQRLKSTSMNFAKLSVPRFLGPIPQLWEVTKAPRLPSEMLHQVGGLGKGPHGMTIGDNH